MVVVGGLARVRRVLFGVGVVLEGALRFLEGVLDWEGDVLCSGSAFGSGSGSCSGLFSGFTVALSGSGAVDVSFLVGSALDAVVSEVVLGSSLSLLSSVASSLPAVS